MVATAHSEIWFAVRDDGGGEVVLKVLKARRPDAEPYRRFRDEVTFLLKHRGYPGVLPLLDAHAPERLADDARAWLVMPVARLVQEALDEEPGLERVAEAVAAYARTLAGLAAEGIFHRDLKPNNLFEFGGEWLVGDFGLVAWPDKQQLTEKVDKLGPANFIAPEMVGDPVSADPGPADVWSLAKTLWALAVGDRYAPPGQLRPEQEATSLRVWVAHERAYGLESVLERATELDPRRRLSMTEFADELEAWLSPPVGRSGPAAVAETASRVRSITAPAERQASKRLLQEREMSELFLRLRDGGIRELYAPMFDLAGRVHVDESSLLLHSSGGRSGRSDAIERGAESLTAAPAGALSVTLTADVAYELFADQSVHLLAGIYVRGGASELPEVIWVETRHVRLGSQIAARATEELGQGLVDRLPQAAQRFAELLEEAEKERQRRRQPQLESVGDDYIFRTLLDTPGTVEVLRKADGSRDGLAATWSGGRLTEIRADGDRLYVRSERNEGWVARNHKGGWALSGSRPIGDGGDR